jgi:hypothetical protein
MFLLRGRRRVFDVMCFPLLELATLDRYICGFEKKWRMTAASQRTGPSSILWMHFVGEQ